MSYTELFKFTKGGGAKGFAETRNSHRGAMAVWNIMEDRYLPAIYFPFNGLEGTPLRKWRVHSFEGNDADAVWGLAWDKKVSETDRICMMSTFDDVIVNRDNIPKLIEAFRKFDGDTSLPEQADEIEKLYNSDKDFIAIAWNQTSVNGDHWANYNKETGENKRYNILKNKKHFELFDELNKADAEQKAST